MNCERAQTLALAASYGDPEAWGDTQLASHVASCDECRREEEQIRRFVPFLGAVAGRMKTAVESRRPRSEERKKQTLVLVDLEFALQRDRDRDVVELDDAAATTAKRLSLRTLLATAGATALVLGTTGVVFLKTTRRTVPPPARATLAKEFVPIALDDDERVAFDAGPARVAADGAARLRARVWASAWEFEKDSDARVLGWVSRRGLLAANLLEVVVEEGAVTVSNDAGTVHAKTGERAFAVHGRPPDRWSESSAAGESKGPAAGAASPAILARVEFPPGTKKVAVEVREGFASDSTDSRSGPRRVDVLPDGSCEIPARGEGPFLLLPVAEGAPVFPEQVVVVAFGAGPSAPAESIPPSLKSAAEGAEVAVDLVRVPHGEPALARLKLRAAGRVNGTVRDATGRGIPGAKVAVGPSADPLGFFTRLAQSSNDGSFGVTGVPARFVATAAAPDGRTGRANGEVRGGEAFSIDIDLGAAASLVGRVRMASGTPVPGARVYPVPATAVVDEAALPRGRELVSASAEESGPDGSFRLTRGLGPGSWRAFAKVGEGLAGWSKEAEPGLGGATELIVALRPIVTIEGRVGNLAGQPLAAEVTVARGDEPSRAIVTTKTDLRGVFKFTLLGEGDWALTARAPGYRTQERPVRTKEGSNLVEVRLARRSGIARVRVVGPDGASAVHEFPTPFADPMLRVGAERDAALWLLPTDPRPPADFRSLMHEGQAYPIWSPAGEVEMEFPEGAESAWVALVVCGRLEVARKVRPNDEPLSLPIDPASVAASVGAVTVVVKDAATEERIGSATPWFLARDGGTSVTPSRGGTYGPLRAGTYDLIVPEAGAYEEARVAGVNVDAGKVVGPIEIRLERKR